MGFLGRVNGVSNERRVGKDYWIFHKPLPCTVVNNNKLAEKFLVECRGVDGIQEVM